jgi:hypothetical protein
VRPRRFGIVAVVVSRRNLFWYLGNGIVENLHVISHRVGSGVARA